MFVICDMFAVCTQKHKQTDKGVSIAMALETSCYGNTHTPPTVSIL